MNDLQISNRARGIAMDSKSERRAKVREIINDECIARVPAGSKELPALGGVGFYTWQFYLRRAVLDPVCLQLVCDDFWGKFEGLFTATPFQLAGVESAAVPIITALIIEGARRGHKLNAFTIRKERKNYGKRNLVEGTPSSAPVLFIDDLTSPQHNAFWHAMRAIRQEGLAVNGWGYVLVRKTKSNAQLCIQTSMGEVIIESPFTLADFSLAFEDYKAEKAILSP